MTTGIVEDRVSLRLLSLDGDRRADLSVHGGAAKAVHAYPLEHYPFWHEELAGGLPLGAFGENLTVAELPLEEEVAVGALALEAEGNIELIARDHPAARRARCSTRRPARLLRETAREECPRRQASSSLDETKEALAAELAARLRPVRGGYDVARKLCRSDSYSCEPATAGRS